MYKLIFISISIKWWPGTIIVTIMCLTIVQLSGHSFSNNVTASVWVRLWLLSRSCVPHRAGTALSHCPTHAYKQPGSTYNRKKEVQQLYGDRERKQQRLFPSAVCTCVKAKGWWWKCTPSNISLIKTHYTIILSNLTHTFKSTAVDSGV